MMAKELLGKQEDFLTEIKSFLFNLLPDKGQKFPAFINLQQYYVEEYLIERCFQLDDYIDLGLVTSYQSLPK